MILSIAEKETRISYYKWLYPYRYDLAALLANLINDKIIFMKL